ncbi:MAG TPA: hypothetical protein VGI85_14365 [Chthoniobacterales bacterium]
MTFAIEGGAFFIMGDKSPKSNQKQKAQKIAKASSTTQKKNSVHAAKAAEKPRK